MSPQFEDDMHISTRDGFKKHGFSEKMIDELVSATLIVNYGQSSSVHKLVGKWTVYCISSFCVAYYPNILEITNHATSTTRK